MAINWSLYKNFQESEYSCNCGCGAAHVSEDLVAKIQELRDLCGFALPITSGVRCKTWNEMNHGHPSSAHLEGRGVDLGVDRSRARIVLQKALDMDCFEGIGISQHTKNGRFLHLDLKPRAGGQKAFWSYS